MTKAEYTSLPRGNVFKLQASLKDVNRMLAYFEVCKIVRLRRTDPSSSINRRFAESFSSRK